MYNEVMARQHSLYISTHGMGFSHCKILSIAMTINNLPNNNTNLSTQRNYKSWKCSIELMGHIRSRSVVEWMCYSQSKAGKWAYYAFDDACNRGNIKCWVIKKYLFDTLVTPMLLYWVEEWGGSVLKSIWKEFENVQKHFITKFLQVKKQKILQSFYKLRNKWHTPSSSLRCDHCPLRSWSLKGLLNTCLRFKKVPHINFLELQ